MADLIFRLSAALADRYRIERELGHGGMATVYLAADLKHDRNVAVKVLRPELAAVLGAERFVQEIKTTASLQHPHILPLFDSGQAEGFLYYVMPYIEGETLRDKLNRERQLSIDEAVKITTEVADALDYAHRQGVIHRDIKPENILLHDGRPMVADFGIALAVSAAAGGRMTETGLSLGTPHYMSPEQATAEKNITHRSDIYSLGAVLYEMLTGSPPHLGSSAHQIIMKIVTEEPADVTMSRPSVPAHTASAVAKALQKLPADRFETAQAFSEALADTGFRFGPRRTPVAAVAHVSTYRRIMWVLAATAIVLALLLARSVSRSTASAGPRSYDVALPESAAGWFDFGGIAVSAAGEFVVYSTRHDGRIYLWYRSLLDDESRRLSESSGARTPSISPDGSQVAFLRTPSEGEFTVQIMAIDGGPSATLATADFTAWVEWLSDGQVQIVDVDGGRVRRIDPGSGAATTAVAENCMNPAPLPDPGRLLCGGGGQGYAHEFDLSDPSTARKPWVRAVDSTLVAGSHFRVIDGKYLVYASFTGDLFAAPVDLETRTVGTSVRLVTGLAMTRVAYAAAYGIAASGTLVYAPGRVGAVGRLVAATETSLDTLPLGPAAFLRLAPNPDGQRLAAVVQTFDGQELRLYDLRTGSHVVLASRPHMYQPIWSPTGDRLLFSPMDSVLVSHASSMGTFELRFEYPGFAPLYWLPDERLVGVEWDQDQVIVADLSTSPVTVDTIRGGTGFVRPSPDGRWLAYNSRDMQTLWLEPFPATGERYQVAGGIVINPQWTSATEFIVEVIGSDAASLDRVTFERVRITPGVDRPIFERQFMLAAPRMIETPGESFQLMPDGRVLFLQAPVEEDARYIRVIPNWVSQMKRAVDEANR